MTSTSLVRRCDNPACAKQETSVQKLVPCDRCKAGLYCDAKCQRQDWTRHELHCSPPVEQTLPFHKKEEEETNPYLVPLTLAIRNHDVDKARMLLLDGHRPHYMYIFNSFDPNEMPHAMINLLVEFNALPTAVTLATFKLILFAKGNPNIQQADFLDAPDLDINGGGFLSQSPITLFAKRGYCKMVEILIGKGARDRPLRFLFLGTIPSHFGGLNHYILDEERKRIMGIFLDDEFCRLENQCKVAEVLLRNPTVEMDVATIDGPESFAPFILWAAINNRRDLFDLPHFVQLFYLVGASNAEIVPRVIGIAAAFDATQFILGAHLQTTLSESALTAACDAAAADGNMPLLGTLVRLFDRPAVDVWNADSHKKIFKSPLFWAISNNHLAAVEFILGLGVDPEKRQDVSGCGYLHLAASVGQVEVVQCLLSHKADVRRVDILKRTVLQMALDCEHDAVADVLRVAMA